MSTTARPACTTVADWDSARVEDKAETCQWCPMREDCLRDALAEEGGIDASGRGDVRGGYTPHQRARTARGKDPGPAQGPGRPQAVRRPPGICDACGTTFTPSKGSIGRYCSQACYLREISESRSRCLSCLKPIRPDRDYCSECRLRSTDYDEASVTAILEGEWRMRCTKYDKAEVCRRWRAAGGSLNALERLTGWNARRYTNPEYAEQHRLRERERARKAAA